MVVICDHDNDGSGGVNDGDGDDDNGLAVVKNFLRHRKKVEM